MRLWRLPFGVTLACAAACSLTSLEGFTGGEALVEAGVPGADAAEERTETVDAISPSEAASPTASDIYRSTVLEDTPAGYYRFEERSGDIAKDEVGAHDGNYMLAPTLDEPGIAGSRGVLFPRDAKSYVRIATTSFRFAGNDPFTIEMWAKPQTGNQAYQWLATTEHDGDPRQGWTIWAATDGALNYEVWGGSRFNSRLLTSKLTNGTYHHIVGTYNGATLIGYYDGKRDYSIESNGTAPDVGTAVVIGCRPIDTTFDFCLDDWTMDEFAIYTHVLDAKRVTAHYDAGAAK
jgi:hypothetical protein